ALGRDVALGSLPRHVLQCPGDGEVPAGHPCRHGVDYRARPTDRRHRHRERPVAGAAAQSGLAAGQPPDHLRRRSVPLAATAGRDRDVLFRRAGRRLVALGLRLDLAVAVAGAYVVRRGNLLGGHRLDRPGAVGGGTLDRPVLRPDAVQRDPAAGAAAHDRAAHQPHHRHHQRDCARHGGRPARDSRHGLVGGVEFLQSVAAHDGCGGLSRAVPARGGGRALDRDKVRMEEIVQAFFNAEIAHEALPIVWAGLLNTVLLSLLVVPLGLLGGLILALLAHSRNALLRWVLMGWVEILRAGIESIPHGQVEAARSTGLSNLQAMIYIVLPQAVRNVLPDLLSNTL